MIEAQLLSKVIDENSFYVLNKYNVRQADFQAYPHVYEYVRNYVLEYGQTPDYRNVVGEFEDFDYQASVHDSFAYLCKQVKSASAKRSAALRLEQITENFQSMKGDDFAKWLYENASAIKAISESANSNGSNYAINGQERKDWYMESKEKRTFTYIPTPYPSLTKWLGGGFELGDGSLIMAYTNRGKSWIGSHVAVTAHKEGYGVLYYSPELTKKQQMFRYDTLNGHFSNTDVRRGNLENEGEYFDFLDKYKDGDDVTPFIVKTMEDLPHGLSTDVIEADLQMNPNVKLVVIDGFNLMNHGRGGREGMTVTSRKLRQLWGKYQVHGVTIHQTPTAAENKGKKDDEDIEESLEPPQLTDYSETISVIQDNANVLTFNQKDGVGKALLAKCREPYVGEVLDLRCNFNLGWITESTPVDYF